MVNSWARLSCGPHGKSGVVTISIRVSSSGIQNMSDNVGRLNNESIKWRSVSIEGQGVNDRQQH